MALFATCLTRVNGKTSFAERRTLLGWMKVKKQTQKIRCFSTHQTAFKAEKGKDGNEDVLPAYPGHRSLNFMQKVALSIGSGTYEARRKGSGRRGSGMDVGKMERGRIY